MHGAKAAREQGVFEVAGIDPDAVFDEFLEARDEERELLRQGKLENPGAGPLAELHGRGDEPGGADNPDGSDESGAET